MGCVLSSDHAAVKDENAALKARVSLVQTSSHEYEQRLHRASQNELQYQDQIENERMAMQAAVADLEQSVRDCQAQLDFERSQVAEREVELDQIHQERLAEMRAESDAAKSQLVEVTERQDARVHFEQTGRTQMEASLSNQSTMVAALQGQLAQSLSSFSALQEENKQLVLQVEYYSSNLKKLHSQAVRKSQDLEDEESFGWDDMVEVVEEAVSEAPTSHRASPTDPVPVSATLSASSVRVPGVAAVDRPAASPSPEGPAHHQADSDDSDDETDETDEVFELPPAAPQAALASPCSRSAATAAESAFPLSAPPVPSPSTATAAAVTSTVPVLEGPASDAGAVTKGGLLEAPASTSSPTKKTDTAMTGAVGDPTTAPDDLALLERLLSDGSSDTSTAVSKASPAALALAHRGTSATAADFGHLQSVMGNLTQNVYGAKAAASPALTALRPHELAAEIDHDDEYIEVSGKSSQAVELQSALDPGPPVPVVPGGPLGGQPTHPTNGSPDALTNTSAQKITEPAVDDEEDDTDDDDGMEV